MNTLAEVARIEDEVVAFVARQPGGDVAEVPLSALRRFQTRKVGGGMRKAHYFSRLYAIVTCTDLPDAWYGHSGAHGPCPHRILVHVERTEPADALDAIHERVGYTPPTDEERERERERVKAEALERMGAEGGPPDDLRPLPECPFGGRGLFNYRLNADLSRLEFAVAGDGCEHGEWYDLIRHQWYFDRETGHVVLVGEDCDGRDPDASADRYERIESLREVEVDLLGIDGVREVADAFVRSRGFLPRSRGDG